MPDTTTAEVTTASVLQDMLTENTGRHFLDSGGAYGRSWERNQGRDFASEPEATISWKWSGVTLSVFHFLKDRLEYVKAGDEAFLAWGEQNDDPWLVNAEQWVEEIGGTGIYGDGKPVVVNTYNGDDALSQTIQYVYFTLESATPLPGAEVTCSYCEKAIGWNADHGWATDDVNEVGAAAALCEGTGSGGEHEESEANSLDAGTYVLLQIHGGCDVRGGYTKPRLFAVTDHDGTAILDNARVALYCSNGECLDSYGQGTRWESDNAGYSWYSDGDDLKQERVEVTTAELPPVEERVGKLVVDTDEDVAYCPVCGTGTLQAAPWP